MEIYIEKKRVVFNPGKRMFIPPGNKEKQMTKILPGVVRIVLAGDA